MKGRKLWVIAFLAFITNGFSLLGIGQGSAGSVARSIEANHNIARNIETAEGDGHAGGQSADQTPGRFFRAVPGRLLGVADV